MSSERQAESSERRWVDGEGRQTGRTYQGKSASAPPVGWRGCVPCFFVAMEDMKGDGWWMRSAG